MSKIILQPAGSSDASEHYVDTIENPVDINRIRQFVSQKQYQRLSELYRDGKVPVWGVVPGKNKVNLGKWSRIESGDVTLFARKKQIFASAVVSFKMHNRSLSLKLWGTDPNDETWEYIYFLDEVRKHSITYTDFNKTIGYDPNYIIQGFNVIDEQKSIRVFNAFDLESFIYTPPVSEDEFDNAVVGLDSLESLDTKSESYGRLEQGFIRNHLFKGKKYSTCGICNKEYPVSFLVAAHIKKRSSCTLDEKKDYRLIAMPMCRFGCDELYEKGYIAVNEGKVLQIKSDPITSLIQKYIDNVIDNDCKYWNKSSSKYFKWHYECHTI